MSESQQFRLPDVGEGLTEAEIVAWRVGVGDVVAHNDVIVDIETAKAVVELPSPFAGVVEEILVEAGVTVPVGTAIIAIGPGGRAEPEEEKPQVLVGPGPKEAAARQRRIGAGRVALLDDGERPSVSAGNRARTTPPVRFLAKQLGVDLEEVAGSVSGLVTRDHVMRAAEIAGAEPDSAPAGPGAEGTLRETRIPVKGVRQLTAESMSRSAFTAPHVTEWLTVDMTRSMELVRALKANRAWAGVRVNPLVVVARAFLLAVRAFPDINASWDGEANEIVLKHYVNLGIAAATPRGLLVPNIKNAHTLDLRGLATELEALVATARAGKTQPADMANGTVTITNIGALGVDAGTPILNPGESAILAFGAVRPQPWVVGGEIRVREVAQLAMSFDHRLVDGELGSRVLARTGEILTDPGTALVYV